MSGELFRPQGPQTGDGRNKPDDQSLKPDVRIRFRREDGEIIFPTESTRPRVRTKEEADAMLRRLQERVQRDKERFAGRQSIMGDDYRGLHRAAVSQATYAIGELQEALAMATERCDVAVGAILSAIGLTESSSGQAAMGIIAGAKDRIQEIYGSTNEAVDQLNQYGAGF